ncbi:acetyl/propionyl/methylcrotonyl-CoA carboxylase subunit alpha [Rhodobacteraceae bacterium NNCM2]|nr:acetyl/propionyl/methylcrotonyl-CoA carboxylase subunit alpha [Coraliihabitans acroporae]
MTMFSKLLIANRGEIACRVIRTARRMGIATVAVYSEADRSALHVALADEAVCIGPAPVGESYLRGDRIVEAALKTGAGAVHPGYGFLSENPDFVERIEAAGLVFIGPPASAIRAMGLKDAAKRAMEAAGVPVVPGYHGDDQDPAFLAGRAAEIGYPVLIKARAGGGGKGMRRVDHPQDFYDALAGAQREGQASFGDPACLIEKYVATPRHIEIQVFGDSHGNVVHLFERDCSLQRRHQKVIEEAPAPGMPEGMRQAMGEAAVKAAAAIGYQGAGTIEFIVDASDGLREDAFYFMEMNTRLQVEHPVTEAITGLDLVEWQLRVAAGEPLPLRQQDLAIDGHAFEARIYAEDAAKGFLPATGTLAHLSFPEEARVDTGIRQGDTITPFYDPMIAKVITHGPTREIALARLTRALAGTEVAGSVTNIAFLGALARHAGFAAGEVDTGLIARDLDGLLPSGDVPNELVAFAALSALGLLCPPQGTSPFARAQGWRLWGRAHYGVTLTRDGEMLPVTVLGGPAVFEIDIAGQGMALDLLSLVQGGEAALMVDGRRFNAKAVRHGDEVTVFMGDRTAGFRVADPLTLADEAAAGGDVISAPMSGAIKAVSAKPGASVAAGEALMVMEAMKMEHSLTAPRDGIVAEVLVEPGLQVEEGALLLRLEAEDEAGG